MLGNYSTIMSLLKDSPIAMPTYIYKYMYVCIKASQNTKKNSYTIITQLPLDSTVMDC